MASVLHWSINQPFHEFFHQSEFQFFFLYSKRFKIKIFILISSGASAKNKINSPKTAPPYQRSTNPVNPFFVIFPIFYIVSMYLSRFLHLHTTLTIWLVRDFGLYSYQVTRKVKAGYNPSHTTETLIGYIVCCVHVLFISFQLLQFHCYH